MIQRGRFFMTKKNKIKKIKFNWRDDLMLDLLGKFNCATEEQIKKYCFYNGRSISIERINKFIKEGYLRTDKITIDKKSMKVYFLDTKGVNYVKRVTTNTTNKAYSSTSLKHDLKQLEYVMNNFNIEDIKKYYKSEWELEKATDGMSRTDGALIFDDERENIFIETETQHYTEDMKNAKKAYAKAHGGIYKANKVRI